MKNLANKDEILEKARQRASVDQKTDQTMKKQKTSIKFWTFRTPSDAETARERERAFDSHTEEENCCADDEHWEFG